MASRENRLQALRLARSTGKVAVTERIHLIQGGDAVLAIAPLITLQSGDGDISVRNPWNGFALVIFLLSDIAQIPFPHDTASAISYWVVDETVASAPIILAANTNNPPAAFSFGRAMLYGTGQPIEYVRSLDVAGRHWVLHAAPTRSFVTENFQQATWYVLLGAILLAGLMGALTLGITGREDDLREKVESRTSALSKLKEHYQQLFDNAPDANLIMSLDGGTVKGLLPITALTADVMIEHRARYLNAGVNDLVAKPIDWHVLSESLKAHT